MLEKLYQVLRENNLYSKSFDEFLTQYQDDDYKKKVYNEVSRRGLYSKDYASFAVKYNTRPDNISQSSFMPSIEMPNMEITETQEQNTMLEDAFGKNLLTDFVSDIYRAGQQGLAQSSAVDETFKLFRKGNKSTDAEIDDFINMYNKSTSVGVSDEMLAFQKIYEEEGKDTFAWMKGVSQNLSVLPQLFTSSMVAMVRSLESDEVIGAGLAAGGTGAAAGSLIPILGTAAGGIGGAMGGIGGAMETSLTFAELLKNELGEENFTRENVRALLSDPQKYQDIKERAVMRGAAIGAVETLTGGLAGKAVTQTAKMAGRLAQITAGTTIEAAGGSIGEIAGRAAADQDMDVAEILFEGFAGMSTAPVTVGTALMRTPEYSLNGEKMTGAKFREETAKLSDKAIAMADIKVKNDDELAKVLYDRQSNFILDNQLDDNVTDKADRAKVVELEKQIKKLEGSKTNFNKAKVNKLKAEQKEIIDKYIDIDVKRAETFGKSFDVDVKSFDNQDDVDAFIDKFNKDNDTKFSSGGLGSILQKGDKQVVVINKAAAAEVKNFTTGQHEILHAILNKSLKNNDETAIRLGKELKGYLDKLDIDKVKDSTFTQRFNQYKQYEAEGKYSEAAMYEEVLTLASEAMASGDLKFEQSVFDNMIDMFRQFIRKYLDVDIEINSGRDVYNFIKDYNKSFKEGKVFKSFEGLQLKGDLISEAQTTEETTQQKKSLFDVDPFEQYRLDPAERKERVNRLYQEGGLSNLGEIIKPFLPIARDLVKSRQKMDNVGRQERQDLINEYTAATIEKLMQHIQAFDPSKNKDFDAYINSYVEFKRGSAAKKLQTKETKLTESQERKAKKKVDDTVEEVDTPPISSKITLEPEIQEKFNTNVENLVVQATKLIALGKSPKQVQKFLVNKFRKQNIAKDIKKTIKDKKVYKKFLENNFETFFNDVNVETLNKRFRGDKNNPDLFSKSTGKRYKRSDTSEPYQFAKQPWSYVEKRYLDYFLEDTAQNVNNKKDKVVEEMSNYMSFEAAQNITQAMTFSIDKHLVELSELTAKQIIKEVRAGTNIRQKFSLMPDEVEIVLKHEKPITNILKEYNVKKDGATTPEIYDNHKLDILETLPEKDIPIIKKFLKSVEWRLEQSKFNRFTVYLKTKLLTDDSKTLKAIGKVFTANNKTNQKEIITAGVDVLKMFSPKLLKQLGFNTVNQNLLTRFGLVYANLNLDNAPYNNDNKALQAGLESAKKHMKKTKEDPLFTDKESKLYLDPNYSSKHLISKGSVIANKIQKIQESNAKNKQELLEVELGDDIRLANENNPKLQVGYNLKIAQLMRKYFNNPKKKAALYKLMQGTTSAKDSIFKSAIKLDFVELVNGKKQFTRKGSRQYIEHLQENVDSNIAFEKLNDQYMRGKIDDNAYIEAGLEIANEMKISINDSLNTDFMNDINKVLSKGIFKLAAVPASKRKNFYHIGTKKDANTYLAEAAFNNAISINATQKLSLDYQVNKFKNYDKALEMARRKNPPKKGASFIDFDDTLATSDSKIIVNNKPQIVNGKQYGYETWADGRVKMTSNATEKITPAEFARDAANFESIGATFDFSEFNEVKRGKKGPFFNKAKALKDKFGNSDIYIITARPAAAAVAIRKFLKGVGLDIKQDNIITLEDGRPEAKAEVIVEMAAKGYNDFLFADDVNANVKAVKNVLDVLDIKGKTYQVEQKFSLDLDKEFNQIIADNKGLDPNAKFSEAAARVRGAKSDSFWKRLFVPPSAEDFLGLMYHFVGKGKKGEKQLAFLKKALIDPFSRAFNNMNTAKQRLSNEFDALNKEYKTVKKKLTKATDYNNFTFGAAIRVYLWDKNGIEIPGISKRDLKALTDIVKNDPDMTAYADRLGRLTNQPDGYVLPNENWVAGSVLSDINDINTKVNRKEYLKEWVENKNIIFSKKNLNKIEALYGTSFRQSLEDILYRMENGTNRQKGKNALVNRFTDWVNNSVGTIMFFNRRSAVLQLISSINFINWSDNNPIKFAGAIANFPQFVKDFVRIFNSDMLKQRRAGLQTDVSASEIVNQAANSKDKFTAIVSHLLKKGFIFTQIADSFAIATGGATLFRNRTNTYVKQGMSLKDAEAKAFLDFQEISEVSQQSARPDLISEQQAGPLGRIILAFQNTPMQYTRLIKKAALDLANGRGDTKTNISKILYYGAMQNLIFNAMQQALFAIAFDDEEDEKTKKRYNRIANSMADTILRGTGVYGAAISTIKNVALKFIEQDAKGFRADHTYTLIEALNLSPPIGSKARKVYGATQTIKFNRKEISEKGFALDNPAYEALANVLSAGANLPLDQVVKIIKNTSEALNNQNQAWQRIALALGWNTWDLGIEQQKREEEKKKKTNKKKTNRVIFH